jgi:hypothetical protein
MHLTVANTERQITTMSTQGWNHLVAQRQIACMRTGTALTGLLSPQLPMDQRHLLQTSGLWANLAEASQTMSEGACHGFSQPKWCAPSAHTQCTRSLHTGPCDQCTQCTLLTVACALCYVAQVCAECAH